MLSPCKALSYLIGGKESTRDRLIKKKKKKRVGRIITVSWKEKKMIILIFL